MDDDPDSYWNTVQDPPLHWDRLGVPISLGEWARLMEDYQYRRIAEDLVGDKRISTVWTGISSDPFWPYVFETMVFDLGPDEDYAPVLEDQRYTNEPAARIGHERIVGLLQELETVRDQEQAHPDDD